MKDMYKDIDYLIKYDLDISLFKQFNLEPYDIYPIRSIFIVNTDKGDKILKKIDYSKDELLFINEGLNYIRDKFDRIMNFNKTVDGDIYALYNEEMYCMIDIFEGRECDYSNPIDIFTVAKGLGELHAASSGFNSQLDNRVNSGKMINKFNRRLKEMEVFKTISNLSEYNGEFDQIFLENIDHYIEEIKRSIKLLEASSYYKLCEEKDKVILCHHDLAYHNVIIKNNEAYFIDFDYAIVDLKVHDICNFINKVLKSSAYDIGKGKKIMDEYTKVNSIDKREMTVLYGLLTFPQDFYSISRDYYTRRKDWSEQTFINKIKKKTEIEEFRIEFLKEFEELL
ncbi:CotS family spore coat protein [Clostridium sp. MSJ-11]|uniref:CotS family spore coat protein n=1 Tax=Clostridium mobile TaxID=2841512 RepID=A0ABS6EM11_9CLOT|nr:CotS family spore coat protein [Clostridium mobile]MBU5486162.1 CotS family spore coat protein [Clostridium mobile]